MGCMAYLTHINKNICDDSKIRVNDIIYFKEIDIAIKNAMNSKDYKTTIERAIYAAALIKLYQPFFDGNNRTALVVLKDILNKKGIYFDYEHAAKDMEEHSLTIPTIYSPNDRIINSFCLKKYIKQ